MGESGINSGGSEVGTSAQTGSNSGEHSFQRNRTESSLNLCLIQSKLNMDLYEDPLQFANDIRVLFNESKLCNASKKSRVSWYTIF